MAKAGVFDEAIKALKEANGKIAVWEESVNKLDGDTTMGAAEKQAALMEVYNAAITSFVGLAAVVERVSKTQKASMWRKKEFAIKKYFKEGK